MKSKLKSDYTKYNKIGYYNEIGIKTISFSEIDKVTSANSQDISEIANKTQYKIEAAIVRNGKKYFYIEGINKNRVDIEINLIHNSSILHSHPNGTSFSAEDIFEIITFNGKSIIAFNDDYMYIFKNNILDDSNFMHVFSVTLSEIEELLIKKVNNGTITRGQMDFSINHRVWLEISKKLKGFDYEAYRISK